MDIEQIETDISRIRGNPSRRATRKSPVAQKMKEDLAERRARLADYFLSVSEPIEQQAQ